MSDSGPAGHADVAADSTAPGRARGAWGDSHSLPPGTRVGRYDIVGVLGEGGFGVTYRARDQELRRDVALKEYLPAGFALRHPDGTVLARSTQVAETFLWGRERFADEARTLARLEKAAGIVNVYDIISANGTAYMVMEFVQGETLEARLRREGTLHQPSVERMCFPLLDGLEQVHRAGFLHRDIKPANILLDPTGLPTLIDFGASRVALQGRTQTMTAVYTPGYAAFEQFTSAKQGPWTDIYGLGATLYHCITGNQPPSAADRMREDTMVPAMAAGKGRYATGLLAAVDAALKLRERERPQTIADWRQLMLAAGRVGDVGPAEQRRPIRSGEVERPQERPPLRWRLWAGVVGGLVLVAAGGAYVAPLVSDMIRQTEGEGQQPERNFGFPFDGTWSSGVLCTPTGPESSATFVVRVANGRGEWADLRPKGVRIAITQERGQLKLAARWQASSYEMSGETIATATSTDRLEGTIVAREFWPSEPPKCLVTMKRTR